MADPRFFENLGPFSLAQICEKGGIAVPADASRLVHDLADLSGAAPEHLTFFTGARHQREAFAASRAGVCLVPQGSSFDAPAGMTLLPVAQVAQSFARIAMLFYPD